LTINTYNTKGNKVAHTASSIKNEIVNILKQNIAITKELKKHSVDTEDPKIWKIESRIKLTSDNEAGEFIGDDLDEAPSYWLSPNLTEQQPLTGMILRSLSTRDDEYSFYIITDTNDIEVVFWSFLMRLVY
jgi:hypothetical protein